MELRSSLGVMERGIERGIEGAIERRAGWTMRVVHKNITPL